MYAFQAAYCGFDVTIWLRSEGSIGRTQPKLAHLKDVYTQTITRMDTPEGKAPQVWANVIADHANFDMYACLAQTERAAASIRLELDLARAAEDADLVIESMAENAEDKTAFYKKLAPLLPEQAVDGADNLGVIVHTFIRQAIARDRVYAVRKRQKQFSCTVDVHTLTFSDKYESFSLL